MTHYTYIGPYVRCESRTYTAMQTTLACIDPLCARYEREISTPYCPSCGGKREPHGVERVVDAVDTSALFDAMDGALTTLIDDPRYDPSAPNTPLHFWSPNSDAIGVQYSHYEESGVFAIDATRISNEIAAFKRLYADALATLREAYGADNVVVLWGVVHYHC